MKGPIVCNASPLIALEQIGQLSLLQHLFGQILITPAVGREVEPTLSKRPAWMEVRSLQQPMRARVLAASLGAGESETISLAVEVSASRVLLDDRPARRLAAVLGLNVTGTLGILLAAKQRGLVEQIKPLLEALLTHDFRVSEALLEQVLQRAGE